MLEQAFKACCNQNVSPVTFTIHSRLPWSSKSSSNSEISGQVFIGGGHEWLRKIWAITGCCHKTTEFCTKFSSAFALNFFLQFALMSQCLAEFNVETHFKKSTTLLWRALLLWNSISTNLVNNTSATEHCKYAALHAVPQTGDKLKLTYRLGLNC